MYTCSTPDEAWALVNHYLGNYLATMGGLSDPRNDASPEDRARREDRLGQRWAGLLGALYKLAVQMRVHGHNEDAEKIQQLVDMVATLDLTDLAVREAIHARHAELDERVGGFKAALAQAKAKYGARA